MVKKFIVVIILSFILSNLEQANIYGQNSDENFPVPTFNTPQQQNIANELRDAYRQMQQHLCNKQSSEQWRGRFELLLGELVIAQHRTMWATAGYIQLVAYTPTLQPFYVKKDAIRDLLIKAARQKPANATEIQRIVDRLNENSRRFAEAANSKGFGQSIFVVYANGAVLSELDKELNRTNLRKFGINETDYTTLRNEAMKALTDTISQIYSFAVNEINKKIPSTAPRFAVSTSNDYLYFGQILKSLSNTISISFDIEKFNSMQNAGWHSYAKTEFNEADLKGKCQKETVRIMFIPSRHADAEKVKKTLEENSFAAELREILENAVPNHQGKIYYQNKGNYEKANIISGLVRNIENVNPADGTATSSDSPDYSLWLISKKQSEPKGRNVRIVYSEDRLEDANKAAQLLKENGFTVNQMWKRNRVSDLNAVVCASVRTTVNEANEIAGIVKNIEKVTPRGCPDRVGNDPDGADYVLWINGKKQTEPRGKTVRIIYTEDRLEDVNKAAQLLKETGFRIFLYKKDHDFPESYRSKLFINLSIGGTEKEGQEIIEIVKNIEKLTPSASTTITYNKTEQYFFWIVR